MGDFFYSGGGNYVITDEHIRIIRGLNFEMKYSYYYEPMPTCTFDTSILCGIDISEIWKSVHFLTMTADCEGMSPIFESMLRSLSMEELTSDNIFGFSTAYKRPFGNSDVLGDVRNMMLENGCYGENSKDSLSECVENEQKMLNGFMYWLTEYFFKKFKPKYRAFRFVGDLSLRFSPETFEYWKCMGIENAHNNLLNWRVDECETREIKLKEIGI